MVYGYLLKNESVSVIIVIKTYIWSTHYTKLLKKINKYY